MRERSQVRSCPICSSPRASWLNRFRWAGTSASGNRSSSSSWSDLGVPVTWTDKDAQDAMLPRVPLNLGFMIGLIAALGLFFMLPGFAAAIVAFIAIFIIEIITYLVLRNNKVGLNDLSVQFKAWLKGMKPKGKEKAAAKGEVTLIGKHGNLDPPEGEGLQADAAGYDALQEIFAEPLKKCAERIEVVAGDQRSGVKYWVDGMPYDGIAVAKNDGAMAITLLKQSLGMDTGDRRKPSNTC